MGSFPETHNDPLFLFRLRLTSSLPYKNVHSNGCYLNVKENSSPAPPVILTWQYFGSSQERGAYNKHTNDNTFTTEHKSWPEWSTACLSVGAAVL